MLLSSSFSRILRRATCLALALAMLTTALLVIVPGGAEAASWSTDFSSSSGWTISGNQISIADGQLKFNSMGRTSTQYASHTWSEPVTGEYNVTWDITVTSATAQESPRVYVSIRGTPITTTEPSNIEAPANLSISSQFDYKHVSFPRMYLRTSEPKSSTSGPEYISISHSTTYTCNAHRYYDESKSAWVLDQRIWAASDGKSWSNPTGQNVHTLSGQPITVQYSTVHNLYYGNDLTVTGYIDNYAESTPSPPVADPLTKITSAPLLSAFNGTLYQYQATSDGSDVTWSMVSDAPGLSIGPANGTVYGTFSGPGRYSVHITATNETEASVSQSYTLDVYDAPYWGPDNARDQPITQEEMQHAQKFGDALYLSYQSYTGSVYSNWMAKYDYLTGTWTKSIVATTAAGDNSHLNGRLLVDADGYIHYFDNAHDNKIRYVRSSSPESITSWTSPAYLTSGGASYPSPHLLPDGSIIVFYRGSTYMEWKYIRSSNGGASWGSEVTVLSWSTSGQIIYVNDFQDVIVNGEPFFDITWNLNFNSNNVRKDLYFARMSAADLHLYSADGTDLGTSITESEAKSKCLVYSAGANEFDSISTVVYGSGETPVILFTRVPLAFTPGNISAIAWTGTAWSAPAPILSVGNHENHAIGVMRENGDIVAYATRATNLSTMGGDIVRLRYSASTGEWSAEGIVHAQSQMAWSSQFQSRAWGVGVQLVVGTEDTFVWAECLRIRDARLNPLGFGDTWDDTTTDLKVFAYDDGQGFLGPDYEYEPEGPPPAFTSQMDGMAMAFGLLGFMIVVSSLLGIVAQSRRRF